jgi:hypothetical protein
VIAVRRLAAVVLAALVIASCAGTPTTSPAPTEGTPSPSATPSPTPSVPPPSPSPTPVEGGALLPDGILAARLGDPFATVVRNLTQLLGPPDEQRIVRGVQLQGYFSDGQGIRGTLRFVTWPPLSLVFLDRSGEIRVHRVPFVAWFLGWTEGDRVFTTPEGIGLRDTLRDLERAYGGDLTVPTEMGGPCATSWTFSVERAEGTYRGTFEEEPTRASARIASLGVGEEPSC